MTDSRSAFLRRHSDTVLDAVIAVVLVLVCIATIYPFLTVLALSLNDGIDARRGGIYLWPRVFSLRSYRAILENGSLLRAYSITVARTVTGTVCTVVVTGAAAYGLSRKRLRGRKVYSLIFVIGLIFYGGLVPTYMLIRDLGLIDNFLVYIVPRMMNVWYLILMKTYFQQLPDDLEAAAMMDGCSNTCTLVRIIVPISGPIIATIGLFEAVEQWNQWFDAYMYMNTESLQPVQTLLFKIISLSQVRSLQSAAQGELLQRMRTSESTLKAAAVMVTTIPLLTVYGIFHKHFRKGALVGSMKT